jgi:AcrR family transcriptional regulator
MTGTQTQTNLRKKPKDREGNRAAILAAAVAEFAARGLHGGRVDAIAKAGGCDKQLLYYYFTNKEGLYVAALEHAYSQIRESQTDRPLDRDNPLQSLIDLVLASYDFVTANSDVIRLISNENLEKGEYIKKSSLVRGINLPIISKIEEIIEAGASTGAFRPGLDAIEFHRLTSALINHNINNAYTFGYIFDVDLLSRQSRDRFRITIADVISRYVIRLPLGVSPDLHQPETTNATARPSRKISSRPTRDATVKPNPDQTCRPVP